MATAKILTSLPDDTAATALSAHAIARPSGHSRKSLDIPIVLATVICGVALIYALVF
jgi:hypothetical protein